MAGLVDRGRALLVRRVVLPDRDARLDGRHRLDDVLPGERRAALGVRVGQRHRADLVDHRRRVAGGHARELVALLLRVELLLVRDLADVEVEDVAPVLPGGRAEEDVAAHPARAGERGVERLDRHVARADEVDLLLARLRRLLAQPHRADLLRHDVERVEERVEAVGDDALRQRRVVDAVHHDEQLVERERAAAAHAGDHELVDDALHPVHERRVDGPGRLGAHREHPVAPGARLDHEVAVGRQRAVAAVEEVVVDRARAVAAGSRCRATARRMPTASISSMKTMHWPPHLAASFFALRARKRTITASMPDEGLGEAGARDRHERAVERRRDRLGEHRLAGAGRAEEEDAALALAARLLELLARLPEARRRG